MVHYYVLFVYSVAIGHGDIMHLHVYDAFGNCWFNIILYISLNVGALMQFNIVCTLSGGAILLILIE